MYEYKCKLDRVVDGDTIDAFIDLGFKVILKERIRLMGIDCPESRTRNKKEKSWGLAAKARLEELLEEHENKFTLASKLQKKGKFGRVLGTIIINGKDANQLLIEEKLAIPYTGSNKKEGREQHGVTHLWEETWFGDSII
jgi:micrococcal nuclease